MFHNFDINQIVTMMMAILFAVTLHEVAHGYVAYRMGDKTAMLAGRLTLNPVKHLDLFGSFILPMILKLSGSPIIFGYAKPVPVNFANLRNYRWGTIFVSAAGVVANVALALVCGIAFQLLLHSQSLWATSVFKSIIIDLLNFLFFSVVINLVLAIFNLIPIPPLDGSKILAMILPASLRAPFARIERFGMIIIIFLLLTNTISRLISFFLNPLINLFLGR